jgi:hypothetical protein
MASPAKYPRVQTKRREELARCPNQRPGGNILYFNCVVKELPVTAVASSRQTGQDFEFESTIVPQRSRLLLASSTPAVIHRSTRIGLVDEGKRGFLSDVEIHESSILAGSRSCLI